MPANGLLPPGHGGRNGSGQYQQNGHIIESEAEESIDITPCRPAIAVQKRSHLKNKQVQQRH